MYTLKILTDEEFDRLPYNYVKDAMGLADTKTKTAYVRATGVRPLDTFTIHHEIDELVSDWSPHEIDGVRYGFRKWWRRNIERPLEAIFNPDKFQGTGAGQAAGILRPILGAAIGGPLLGFGVGGAMAGGALAGGVGNYQTGGWGSAIPGALTGALTGLGVGKFAQGWQGATASQGGGAPSLWDKLTGGVKNIFGSRPTPAEGLKESAPSLLPDYQGSLGSIGQTTGTQGIKGLSDYALSPTMVEMAGKQGINLGTTGANAVTQTASKIPWYNTELGRIGLGAAIPAIGGMITGGAKEIDPYSLESMQDLRNKITSGNVVPLTDAQRQAVTANLDDEYADAVENLKKQWQGFRPGADIENDSQLREAYLQLEEDYTIKKANTITMTEMGLSQQQIENLSQLAALDVETLAINAGISMQEAQAFQQMLSSWGLIVAGSGPNSPTNKLYDLVREMGGIKTEGLSKSSLPQMTNPQIMPPPVGGLI